MPASCLAAEASGASVGSGAEGSPTFHSVGQGKQQQQQGADEQQQQQQSSDAGLQPPTTPLAPVPPAAAADGTDASATVAETAAPATHTAGSKGEVQILAAARLQLPPRDRQKLLAFAAAYCPSTELPALTDDLVLAQRQHAEQQAAKVLQPQQQAEGAPAEQQQQEDQELSLLLPLQQPASRAFQQQRQQLLHAALSAAATTPYPKGWVDPYKGLLSFGDPQALLAALLSCSSAGEAQQLLEDVLSTQLSGSSANGGSEGAAGGSYCCLQRLLVVGAAAQLLLLMQRLPQGALVEVVAGSPGSKASCTQLKLPHQQELRLQLLHVPVGQLQHAAQRLLQQQPQQQELFLPAGAGDAVAAAGALMSRLQQIADGRQLLQWLPGIETGRFFAGAHLSPCV